MHAKQLSQKIFHNALPFVHAKRRQVVFDTCWSLMNDARLALTSLARHMEGSISVKHKIKKVDRVLGNQHLFNEKTQIYSAFFKKIFESLPTLYVLVDWSGCCTHQYHLLRASLAYQGRSLTFYNEIHPLEKLGNEVVQHHFLKNLQRLLPNDKPVVIITDAGFRSTWFQYVTSFGWNYVGRVRDGQTKLLLENTKEWVSLNDFSQRTTEKIKYMGTGRVGKTSKARNTGHLYLYKERIKGRKGCSNYPDVNRHYSAYHRDPWVLVTSLTGGQEIASKIKCIYKKRMQIEQNFRDDKSKRFGFGWRFSKTRCPKRMAIFCLLATITTLVLIWIGLYAEKMGWHRDFQANTVKTHRVLSFVFLAKQVLRHCCERIKPNDLRQIQQDFIENYERTIYASY